MDSYRVEKQAMQEIALADADAEMAYEQAEAPESATVTDS